MGIETALIAASVIGAAASVGTGVKQRQDAKKEMRKQEQAQDRMLGQMRKQTEEEDSMTGKSVATARRRQEMLAAGMQGRSSTIRTGSPLGLVGEPQVAGKRLLGE